MAIVHKAQVFSCVPRNYSLVLTISLEQNACGEYLLHQKRNSSTWFLASSTSGFFFSLKDWVFLKFEFVSPELRDSEFSVWQSEVSRTRKKEWPVSQRGNSNSSSVTGVIVCKTNLVNRFFPPPVSVCLLPERPSLLSVDDWVLPSVRIKLAKLYKGITTFTGSYIFVVR